MKSKKKNIISAGLVFLLIAGLCVIAVIMPKNKNAGSPKKEAVTEIQTNQTVKTETQDNNSKTDTAADSVVAENNSSLPTDPITDKKTTGKKFFFPKNASQEKQPDVPGVLPAEPQHTGENDLPMDLIESEK